MGVRARTFQVFDLQGNPLATNKTREIAGAILSRASPYVSKPVRFKCRGRSFRARDFSVKLGPLAQKLLGEVSRRLGRDACITKAGCHRQHPKALILKMLYAR